MALRSQSVSSEDAPCVDLALNIIQATVVTIVMRYYKHSLELDETGVHGDLSVIGSEFIGFLASVPTFRVTSFLDSKKVLERMTYGKVIKKLSRGKKVLVKGERKPAKINPSTEELYRELGILPPLPQKEKRARGRPWKSSI